MSVGNHELVVVCGMGGNRRSACRLTFAGPGLDGVVIHRARLAGPLAPAGRISWQGPGRRYPPDGSPVSAP
ncbi:hypothetical protein AB0I28_00510 [Phytomonospora sp. NPDC050363]|uniref:hypothetical protein n=1 Tax=Phytomonospora sp. NPDC050363 TaxID=3155642 RepID=UPI0033CB6164